MEHTSCLQSGLRRFHDLLSPDGRRVPATRSGLFQLQSQTHRWCKLKRQGIVAFHRALDRGVPASVAEIGSQATEDGQWDLVGDDFTDSLPGRLPAAQWALCLVIIFRSTMWLLSPIVQKQKRPTRFVSWAVVESAGWTTQLHCGSPGGPRGRPTGATTPTTTQPALWCHEDQALPPRGRVCSEPASRVFGAK